MRRTFTALLFLLLGIAIGGSFIWFYAKPRTLSVAQPAQKERKILYYRAPMNPSLTSPTPKKDEMGIDYVPVYEEEATAVPARSPKKEKKILYYRAPMNPSVTSLTPKKDEMGMGYVPVYEEEAAAAEEPGAVRISPEKIQKIGVKSEEITVRPLNRVIRTVGRVEPVESKIYVINAKVSGWVEKLYVDKTDQMVMKGGKLLELYSPDLVSAQEEYLLAWKSFERVKASPYPEVRRGAESLLNASAQKLRYWDISDDQIERLKETGAIKRTMTIEAPVSGSDTEKMVVEGQKIEAGEPLFKIIDHSVVWVYGEIYEYEMPYVKVGQTATLSPSYSSTEVYHGKIEHIYSHLGSIRYTPEAGTEVRTEKVRFEVPNHDHKLKLGMYLNIELKASVGGNALAVPDSAVIDTGTRQIVIIDKRDGTFEPRVVKVGEQAEDYYEVREGVKKGEWVVTSANFLIDSESNLKAALGGMGGAVGPRNRDVKKHGSEEKKEEPTAGHGGH